MATILEITKERLNLTPLNTSYDTILNALIAECTQQLISMTYRFDEDLRVESIEQSIIPKMVCESFNKLEHEGLSSRSDQFQTTKPLEAYSEGLITLINLYKLNPYQVV